MIAFSFLNLAETAALAASTTFTEMEAAVGLRHPERPHLRGYTTDLSGGRVTLDFGSVTALDVVGLIHTSFTVASVQGHSADSWGGPAYNPAAISIGRAGTDRRHHAHKPTAAVPFSQRFLSLLVPSQAATEGGTRHALGGIWAGTLTFPPRDIRMAPRERKREARQDIETADGRVLQRIQLDEPAWSMTCQRLAETEAELTAWRAIDRRWSEAPGQAALVLVREAYLSEVYVMRMVSVSEWQHERLWSTSELRVTRGN